MVKHIAERVLSFCSEHMPLVLMYALLALSPLFFLPITADFFEINKQVLIVGVAMLCVVLWAVQSLVRQAVRFTISPLTVPTLLYVAVLLLSTFFGSTYPYEVIMGRGLVVFGLATGVLVVPSLLKSIQAKTYLYVVSGSGVVLSIIGVLEAFGFGLSNLLNVLLKIQLPEKGGFNPAGSVLAGALFLFPLLVANGVELIKAKQKKDRIIFGSFLGILILGFAAHMYVMLPGKPAEAVFTPLAVSWSIAVDTFKNTRTALVGVGPESYSVAFTQFRPLSLNAAPYWNILFTIGRTEFLHILPTMGLVGGLAWLFLMINMLRTSFPMREEFRPLSIITGILVLEQFFFISNTAQLAVLFGTVTLITVMLKKAKDDRIADIVLHLFAIRILSPGTIDRVEQHPASRILALILSLLVLGGVGVSGYFIARAYYADMLLYQSLQAAQKNDGKKTYELQGKVVNLAPLSDRYRRAFASTNFLIAENIADNPSATEQDKNTIPQLIQQAIREAKAATELDGRKTLNWQTLATIYRALINVAQGADQWAIAAYVRAIQTDPTNPMLRLDLGGVYVSTQNYEQAIRLFQQAAELKPDWPNAHFNLANAYKMKGEKQLAIDALRQTWNLLPVGSAERTTVEGQIAQLEKQKTVTPQPTVQQETKPKSTTAPQKTTKTVPEGEIRLPSDLGLPSENPPATTPKE